MCLPHWNVIFKKILTSCQVPQWSEWIKIVLLDEAYRTRLPGFKSWLC